jgi:hypothetical protein
LELDSRLNEALVPIPTAASSPQPALQPRRCWRQETDASEAEAGADAQAGSPGLQAACMHATASAVAHAGRQLRRAACGVPEPDL